MGERAKIILNEYTAKELLKRDDLDLDKFYSTDIKMMVKVAQQELKKKDNIINELYNLFCQLDSEIMKRNYAKANKINFIIRNKLKELKEGNSNDRESIIK